MQNYNIDLLALILKGGPVMVLLLGLSIISLTIIIIKIIQFYKSDLHNIKKIDAPLEMIEKNKLSNAKSLLNTIENFFEDDLTNIPKEWNVFKKIFLPSLLLILGAKSKFDSFATS